MHDLSTFSSANTGAIVMVAVCLLSAVFMVRFLIALLLEERRLIKAKRLKLRKNGKSAAFIRVEAMHGALDELREARISTSEEIPSGEQTRYSRLGVVRLSDRNIGQSTKLRWLVMGLVLSATLRLSAQTAESTGQKDETTSPTQGSDQQNPASAASAPAPTALNTPAITGPLQAAVPIVFDGGPLGKLNLNGIVSGIGLWQGNHIPGDNPTQAALGNGQVFIQKTTDWWQFYVQAGAYNILALGTPFLPTEKAINNLYGPVPVAYLKLAPAKNTSILVGALPTLMGAEYTFDFENMNVERGLLWNQENAINRGIQVNQTLGKFTASLSWNDGYYSNRYSWLSGSLAYVDGPHSVSFIGMGNLGQTAFQTLATPVQNNSVMYAAIYTYTKGNWIVQPYLSVQRCADKSQYWGHTRSIDARRRTISEPHIQTRILAGGSWGIHHEHGKRRGKFRQPDVWSGQRGVVDHVDSYLSIPALLRPRRPFVCSGDQLYARCCFWSGRHESEPAQRSDGSWIYVLKG